MEHTKTTAQGWAINTILMEIEFSNNVVLFLIVRFVDSVALTAPDMAGEVSWKLFYI